MSESTTAESSPPPHRDSPATARRLGLGCAGLALLGLLVPGALWFTWSVQQSAEQQALEDAEDLAPDGLALGDAFDPGGIPIPGSAGHRKA